MSCSARKLDESSRVCVLPNGCKSLPEAVSRYESGIIKTALYEADGSVTKAASLLGVSHQSLGFILKTRHKVLLSERTPVKHRRRKP